MPFVNEMLDSFANKKESQGETNSARDSGNLGKEESTGAKLKTRFRFDVDKVMALLRMRIAGQEETLNAMRDMLNLVRADITDPLRPLYIALFLGPTGVGKTEVVRILAEGIHGSPDAVCRVDMNTLTQDHYAASLTGAPPGYVGSKEGITLLDKEKIEGSYSAPGIVLLDEVEKASDTVIQTLLNVFDNGVMTVASGQQTINFRNSMIFMTSNIGSNELQVELKSRLARKPEDPNGGPNSLKENFDVIRDRLEDAFRPEFLNRIDEIISFNWLTPKTLDDIIAIELGKLNRRVARFHYEVRIDNATLSLIRRKGYDPSYGARAIKRAIRRYVEVPLSAYLIRQESRHVDSLGEATSNKVIIGVNHNDSIVFEEWKG